MHSQGTLNNAKAQNREQNWNTLGQHMQKEKEEEHMIRSRGD